MSRGVLRLLLAAALVLVLAATAIAVRNYERTLAEGRIVLFELAPVDPRSIMQGDFMALDFAVNQAMHRAWSASGDGQRTPRFAIVAVDAEGRAAFLEFAANLPEPAADRLGIRLHVEHGMPRVGPNAFFFQEGTGERYEAAAWGEFRVAADGTALLTALRDERLELLDAVKR
jgi:uncharacterized membrane-anchored protein